MTIQQRASQLYAAAREATVNRYARLRVAISRTFTTAMAQSVSDEAAEQKMNQAIYKDAIAREVKEERELPPQ